MHNEVVVDGKACRDDDDDDGVTYEQSAWYEPLR